MFFIISILLLLSCLNSAISGSFKYHKPASSSTNVDYYLDADNGEDSRYNCTVQNPCKSIDFALRGTYYNRSSPTHSLIFLFLFYNYILVRFLSAGIYDKNSSECFIFLFFNLI
jgi:hypothetical protein